MTLERGKVCEPVHTTTHLGQNRSLVDWSDVARVRPETYGVFSTRWKDAVASEGTEDDTGASSSGLDAAGATFATVSLGG